MAQALLIINGVSIEKCSDCPEGIIILDDPNEDSLITKCNITQRHSYDLDGIPIDCPKIKNII